MLLTVWAQIITLRAKCGTDLLAAVVTESFPVRPPNSAFKNKQTSRKREAGEEPNSRIYSVPFRVEFSNDKGNVWRKVSEAVILLK